MAPFDNVIVAQVRDATRRLIDEFRDLDPETVRLEVDRVVEEHRSARIQTYVPIFTYRFAREALRRISGRPAQGSGTGPSLN